jgi:AP-2 complex subunit alpha
MSTFFSSVTSQPRGLHNFIHEIKNCQTKEEERGRVDKELANIRNKFSTSSNLTSYSKQKYVWKLCYIFMLGYEVDFGHLEFISLLGILN